MRPVSELQGLSGCRRTALFGPYHAWIPRRIKHLPSFRLATLLTYLLCSLAVTAPFFMFSTWDLPRDPGRVPLIHLKSGSSGVERRVFLEHSSPTIGLQHHGHHHSQFAHWGVAASEDRRIDASEKPQSGAAQMEDSMANTEQQRGMYQQPAQHARHAKQSRRPRKHGPGVGVAQERTCPVLVDWGSLTVDPGKGWSAVFTPYNIVFGGGERYLLSVVAVMQRMGYSVDVLVLPSNSCQTVEKLLETAKGLRVQLDATKLRLVQTGIQGNEFQASTGVYSLFMALGNEKLPIGKGIGHVNFYMNQFPFDLDADVDQMHMEALATYDYVLLNSAFSYKWYNYFMDSLYDYSISQYGLIPSIEVLHPSVEAFRPSAAAVHSQVLHDLWDSTSSRERGAQVGQSLWGSHAEQLADRHPTSRQLPRQPQERHGLGMKDRQYPKPESKTRPRPLAGHRVLHAELPHSAPEQGGPVNAAGLPSGPAGRQRSRRGEGVERKDIVLVGRFFEGRQSKGHGTAIEIFERILPQLPEGTQLHLVGNLMPESTEYLFSLMRSAVHLPVEFHVGVPASEVEAVLHSSLVQWHLTGVELTPGEDPASEEHFGISIAEGMSAGCIPVVLKRGGVGDIVAHGGNGFLADSVDSVAELTLHVFNSMTQEESKGMRSKAVHDVGRFSEAEFERRFRVLAQRGAATKPFRHLIQDTRDVVLARKFELKERSSHAAVIIEPRHHYAFEYVVKNVLFHLGPGDWTLYVFHGNHNEAFVRRALAGIQNVKFFKIPLDNVDIPDLNQLMKSPEFWEAIEAQKALIFQTDSLLLRRDIHPFQEYEYVGAPWHLENERWSQHMAAMPHGVGNGGLSLRSVPAMRAVIARHGNSSSAEEQEDWFFVRRMEAAWASRSVASLISTDATVAEMPDRSTAYKFAVEVPCDDLEDSFEAPYGHPLQTLPHVPVGIHAAWYYFGGSAARRQDLLRLLELSVCGYTDAST